MLRVVNVPDIVPRVRSLQDLGSAFKGLNMCLYYRHISNVQEYFLRLCSLRMWSPAQLQAKVPPVRMLPASSLRPAKMVPSYSDMPHRCGCSWHRCPSLHGSGGTSSHYSCPSFWYGTSWGSYSTSQSPAGETPTTMAELCEYSKIVLLYNMCMHLLGGRPEHKSHCLLSELVVPLCALRIRHSYGHAPHFHLTGYWWWALGTWWTAARSWSQGSCTQSAASTRLRRTMT